MSALQEDDNEVRYKHIDSKTRKETYSGSLDTLSGTLASLGLETRLDGRDGSCGTAGLALQEEQTVLLGENSIGRFAGLAGNVLNNVTTQNSLDLLLLETTLDDQALGSINGSRSSQLGKQELNNVLRLTMHPLADIGNVGKDSLLVTITHNRGRNNGVTLLLTGKLGVVLTKNLENARQKL